jgi:hypothetical protein
LFLVFSRTLLIIIQFLFQELPGFSIYAMTSDIPINDFSNNLNSIEEPVVNPANSPKFTRKEVLSLRGEAAYWGFVGFRITFVTCAFI